MWDRLAHAVGKSKTTVRHYLAVLEEQGLLLRLSSRPLRVKLSQAGNKLLFPSRQTR